MSMQELQKDVLLLKRNKYAAATQQPPNTA